MILCFYLLGSFHPVSCFDEVLGIVFLKKKNSSEINSDFSSAQCLHVRSRALTDGQLFQRSLEDVDRRHGNNVTFIVSVWLSVCGLTEMLNHLSSSTLREDEMKASYKGVCLLVLELFFQESNNSSWDSKYIRGEWIFQGSTLQSNPWPIVSPDLKASLPIWWVFFSDKKMLLCIVLFLKIQDKSVFENWTWDLTCYYKRPESWEVAQDPDL